MLKTLCSLSLLLSSSLSQAVTFVAYGDMPYNRMEQQILQEDLAPLVRQKNSVAFVLNVGDLGRPEFSCSDSGLMQTRHFWQKDLLKPVFYTPGDNDWTDCDRSNVPQAGSELARLDALRRIFFDPPRALPEQWAYQQQASHPENQRWQIDDVMFVTQHLVATANGREEILHDDPAVALAQVDLRDQANLDWLQQTEQLLLPQQSKALVIAFQADVNFERCLQQGVFQGFCQQIQQIANDNPSLPILLIHGDTPAYCLDKPWSLNNLWRLNLPGDYQLSDMALIHIDVNDIPQPFYVKGLMTHQRPRESCQ